MQEVCRTTELQIHKHKPEITGVHINYIHKIIGQFKQVVDTLTSHPSLICIQGTLSVCHQHLENAEV